MSAEVATPVAPPVLTPPAVLPKPVPLPVVTEVISEMPKYCSVDVETAVKTSMHTPLEVAKYLSGQLNVHDNKANKDIVEHNFPCGYQRTPEWFGDLATGIGEGLGCRVREEQTEGKKDGAVVNLLVLKFIGPRANVDVAVAGFFAIQSMIYKHFKTEADKDASLDAKGKVTKAIELCKQYAKLILGSLSKQTKVNENADYFKNLDARIEKAYPTPPETPKEPKPAKPKAEGKAKKTEGAEGTDKKEVASGEAAATPAPPSPPSTPAAPPPPAASSPAA